MKHSTTSIQFQSTGAGNMDLNSFQKQAFTTATEPSKNVYYMTLGLTGKDAA